MGACLKTESYSTSDGRAKAQQKMQWHRQGLSDHALWSDILILNLDKAPFFFLEEVQNLYTDILGAFLCPDQLLAVLTEFKRFLYLLALESAVVAQDRAGFEMKDGELISISCKYVPSPAVDRMWRVLITNEHLYNKLCQKLFHGYKFDRDSLAVTQAAPYELTLEKIKHEFPCLCQQVWPERLPQTQDSPYMLIKISDFVQFHNHFCKQVKKDGEISILGEFDALKKKLARTEEKVKQELKQAEERDQIGGDLAEKEKYVLESFLTQDLKDTVADMEDEPDLPREDTLVKQVSNEPDQIKKLMKNFAHKKGPQMVKHNSQNQVTPHLRVSDQGLLKKKNKTDIGVYNLHENEQGKEVNHPWLKEEWGLIEATVWPKLRQSNIAPFAKRVLTVELNSSRELCNSILEEYKKFLLLTQLVKPDCRPLPSRLVELAWKYHMGETAPYLKFCKDNFKGEFQSFKYFFYPIDQQCLEDYGETLTLYEAVFHCQPPYCIWPSPQRRFDFNTIYSAKIINIPGYMHAMIKKIRERNEPPKIQTSKQISKEAMIARILDFEKKKALSGMKFQLSPQYGNQQLLGKNERDFQQEILGRRQEDESFMSIKGRGDMDSMFKELHR